MYRCKILKNFPEDGKNNERNVKSLEKLYLKNYWIFIMWLRAWLTKLAWIRGRHEGRDWVQHSVLKIFYLNILVRIFFYSFASLIKLSRITHCILIVSFCFVWNQIQIKIFRSYNFHLQTEFRLLGSYTEILHLFVLMKNFIIIIWWKVFT